MPSPQPFPLVEERSDALTPTLSHGERGQTLKKATCVAFLLFILVRSDALTPTLSHGEREQTLKTATQVAVLLLFWCGLMPSPQPSPTGRGGKH